MMLKLLRGVPEQALRWSTLNYRLEINIVEYVSLVIISVYFRISLKRKQTPSAKIQGVWGEGGQSHSKDRKSQFLRGRQINPRGGESTPWPP